jgi:hypothetical protein
MQPAHAHPAALPPEELLEACAVEHLRRRGPGGQHRNKVQTGVRLRHRPTGVRAEASERRSQAQNRQTALFRLRVNLALEVRHEHDPQQRPSRLWQSRCRAGRIAVNPWHDDFPAILAEALDVLTACENDPKTTARALACSPSQLTKLLKKESRAITLVNAGRRRMGLSPLQ